MLCYVLKIFFAYCCSYFNKQTKKTYRFFWSPLSVSQYVLKYLFTRVALYWVLVTHCWCLTVYVFLLIQMWSYNLKCFPIAFCCSSLRNTLNYFVHVFKSFFFCGACRIQPAKNSDCRSYIDLLIFIKIVASVVQQCVSVSNVLISVFWGWLMVVFVCFFFKFLLLWLTITFLNSRSSCLNCFRLMTNGLFIEKKAVWISPEIQLLFQ